MTHQSDAAIAGGEPAPSSAALADVNRSWLERAEQALAGGALAGFRLAEAVDFVVARGQGSHVWDLDGREYLDFLLGSGPMILGHAHPAVVEAVQRQLSLGTTFYMATAPAIDLAAEIAQAAGGGGKVKYAATGGEATAYAVRLARAFTNRNKVLKLEGGYHGAQDFALLSVAPDQPTEYPTPIADSAGIPRGVQRDVLIAPYNDLETTARIASEQAADLAAIIIEPQQRGIDPAVGYLEGLRALSEEHRTLLIFDEVVTGFRLAYGGAREYYGVRPDLIAYAKIIGGGFPLAAVWGREEIMAAADPRRRDGQVLISGTLSGNPISTAAGLATLAELRRPGSYERLHELGQRLRTGLRQAGARVGVPVQVVGDGPLAAVFLCDQPVTDYRSAQLSDRARLTAINLEMVRRGILVNLPVKFYLSVAHTDDEVDTCLEAFEAGLLATAGA